MLPWYPLKSAILRAPTEPLLSVEDYTHWGYPDSWDLARAREQHETFRSALEAHGVELHLHDGVIPGAVDACFVCDPVLMTPNGFIELQMGKLSRRLESPALAEYLIRLGVPRLGSIMGEGTVEGGDCFWLNGNTLLIGEGFRTNRAGIHQIRALLPGIDVLAIPMPWCNGPDECLHLQSVVSFISSDLALVHMPFAPIRLVHALERAGFELIPFPPSEYQSLGCNVLCVVPGRVIIAAGNPLTTQRLRARNVDVTEIEAPDLMLGGTGGPTCLTLPLVRRLDS